MGNYKDISFLGDWFSVSFSADHIHLNGFCLSATKKAVLHNAFANTSMLEMAGSWVDF